MPNVRRAPGRPRPRLPRLHLHGSGRRVCRGPRRVPHGRGRIDPVRSYRRPAPSRPLVRLQRRRLTHRGQTVSRRGGARGPVHGRRERSRPHRPLDKNWILLDNQSTVDLFSNPDLLEPRSIHETDGPALRVHSTGCVTVTRMVGMLQGYREQKIGRPWHNLERNQREIREVTSTPGGGTTATTPSRWPGTGTATGNGRMIDREYISPL